MKIVIKTRPFHEMRYPTAGDYWDEADGTKVIQVADLGDWRMNFLVALHEMIETALCDVRGIAEPDVKAFDEANPDADDPGSIPDAPYHKEHMFAEAVERLVAGELGVEWSEYGDRVESLWDD